LEARLFTRADAGTLYLVGQKVLTFEITQNDTFGEDDAHWEEEKQIPPVPLDRKSASGYAAITGEVLNIEDVYTDTVHAFEGPRKYEDILVKSRQRKTPETVDLNTLIQRELEFLQADFTFKHEVKSDVQLAPGLPSFECVYTDFSQAIGNLLRNALDAMHSRDEKELRVHTREQDGVIYIEIRDTGSGISAADIPRLFEPFFTTKASEPNDDEPLGTGLGLYMTKRLLEPYSVEVSVQSELGVGTTFTLEIPLDQNT
jgi:signal transduction histidine kinase